MQISTDIKLAAAPVSGNMFSIHPLSFPSTSYTLADMVSKWQNGVSSIFFSEPVEFKRSTLFDFVAMHFPYYHAHFVLPFHHCDTICQNGQFYNMFCMYTVIPCSTHWLMIRFIGSTTIVTLLLSFPIPCSSVFLLLLVC